ncbi:phospholipase [Micromonospora sp. CA-240977]|uniref:phospholipase n=1 Tax=Micromonospora sp. CA-240977 TaxID=3239957 RepID=UPI003D8BBB63
MRSRISSLLLAAAAAVAVVVGPASSAYAAPADKPAVLASWTQTSVTSYNAWLAAYNNKAAWADYAFDWSTDYCTTSPDNPLGFPFQLSCARHDFGYRNYRALGTFSANKSRLDSAFYADLQRACDTYPLGATHDACNGLAWIYYQAVRLFGSPALTAEQLADAKAVKEGRQPASTLY